MPVIAAADVETLRGAINQRRLDRGLPSFVWTDSPVTTSTPIRAVHFTEAADVIQDLWNRKNKGPLPAWTTLHTGGLGPIPGTVIYATDLQDLQTWLTQYDNTP